MAIKDGKILATGSSQELKNQYASKHELDAKANIYTRDLLMHMLISLGMGLACKP